MLIILGSSVSRCSCERSLRLHHLDKVGKRLAEVARLLGTKTCDKLLGNLCRAAKLGQEICGEEVDCLLTAGLEGVAKEHRDFEENLQIDQPRPRSEEGE